MKKRTFKNIFAGFLAFVMVLSLPGFFSPLAAGAKVSTTSSSLSSSKAPSSVGASADANRVADEYHADNNSDKRVLVIQSNSPWKTTGNETVLKKLADEGYIEEYKISSVLDSIYMDYTEYNMILIANDQNYENYKNYDKIKRNIEKYAQSGGVVLFGACDEGWASGSFSSTLPGNVSKVHEYSYYNYVSNSNNTFVQGNFYTKTKLTDDNLWCNYTSHAYFKEDTLPNGTDIILRSSVSKAPTLVKYGYGEGTIVASGLTWEFAYNNIGDNGYGKYYPDLILYALSFSEDDLSPTPASYDSGFRIPVDGNNFCHTNEDCLNSGFKGVKNYTMSDTYLNRLLSQSSKGEKSAVKAYVNYGNKGYWSLITEIFEGGDYWGGSCYGIATTMALVYEKKLPLSDLAYNTSGGNYHSLRYPCEDKRFLDVTQYYQVSQMLEKGGKLYAAKARTVNDTSLTNQEYNYQNLRAFLKKLVETASSGHVCVLGFSTAKTGHAILVTGCTYDPDNHRYRIRLYDENSVGFRTKNKTEAQVQGKFSEMTVSSDYRFFDWSDDDLNNNTYIEMYLTDLSLIKKLDGSVNHHDYVSIKGDHTIIACSTKDTFRITDQNGQILKFDGKQISGDMNVYAVSTLENARANNGDDSPYIFLEVDASDQYTVSELTNSVDVQMYNDEEFLSLAATKVNNATLSFDDGINITSNNDYTFSAFMSTEEEVGENESNLVSIAAAAKGNTEIKVQGKQAVAKNNTGFTDVTVANYVGGEVAESEKQDSKTITVDNIYAKQEHITPSLDKSKLSLKPGEKTTLKATVTPANATDKTITWISTDNNVVTVDNNGNVTAMNQGVATVIATAAGGKTAECRVTVNPNGLDTPEITKLENTANGVKLTIGAVSGAAKYRVFYKNGNSWKGLGDTTSTTFVHSSAVSGVKYTYTVRCVSADGKSFTSSYDNTGKSITYIAAPKLTAISNTATGVQLKWNKSDGAAKYRVYRKTGNASWGKVGETTALNYRDKTAKSGVKYSYTARCITSDGKSFTSGYDNTGKTVTYIAAPKLTSIANTTTGVQLKWNKSDGAAKYRVYRKTGTGSWSKVGDTTALNYTDKSAKSGVKYSYTARCITSDGKSFTSGYDGTGKTVTYIAAPKITSVSNVSSGILINWSKPAGAVKYRVFRKTGSGSWQKVGDTTALSYTDKSAKLGVNYSYTIRCITSDGKSFTSAYNTNGVSIRRANPPINPPKPPRR